MMSTRFIAEHLVTMSPTASGAPDVHSPGVVDVSDGVVMWSGSVSDAPDLVEGSSTVAVAGVLLPGLVNIHAHTPMLLFRGTGEGLPTDRWLTDVMWPREARLTDDDVFWAMQHGAGELLRNGITTSSEMYFAGDAIARASIVAGLRCIVAAPLIESADFSAMGSIDAQLEAIEGLRGAWSDHATVEIAVGPHAAYSLSRSTLEAVAAMVAHDPMLVHIHVAEQPGEALAVERAAGMTVLAYLDDIGLLGPRTVAAHCVWITPADIELLAARHVGVAHCPASNGRHASGIAPVDDMRAQGIAVGIATDGPASHDRLDLFEEMRTAARYARIRSMDASRMSAADLLAMVTCEAADAVGRPDLGRLTPGSRADMISIDVHDDGFGPIHTPDEIIARVVWAGHRSAIRNVWVEGTQVVANGECVTFDRSEARARMIESARCLAQN
jgi:5-methylthioadenosine/S-adenosylhomocysteine deaminase